MKLNNFWIRYVTLQRNEACFHYYIQKLFCLIRERIQITIFNPRPKVGGNHWTRLISWQRNFLANLLSLFYSYVIILILTAHGECISNFYAHYAKVYPFASMHTAGVRYKNCNKTKGFQQILKRFKISVKRRFFTNYNYNLWRFIHF